MSAHCPRRGDAMGTGSRTSRVIVYAVATTLCLQAGSVRAQVPSPGAIWGFEPGTDYRLGDYDMVLAYFEALAASSDRVVLDTIGQSSLGRPLLLAIISSAENIRNRERYREISRRLAVTRDVAPDEALNLAREGRAVVWVDGGLHATEVAHGQFTPVFGHWLATDEGDEARRIRDNVIVLLMPNMNPDGLDIVVDWYRSNVGTAYETAPVPELYHHYIGHDNNRDWYMFTQLETRAVADQLYHVWFPQIVYNHHQSGPFPGRIWVPPFENPVNPNLDPLVVTSINQIGETMKRRFAREGKPGVSSGIVYDMWWNGSMRGAPDFHNMLGFLTETALYRYATPYCYGADEIPDTFGDRAGNLPAKRPTTSYPDPWLGGCWHLRDPMEYMMTATRAVTDLAARYREDYLANIYLMGRRQIERGERAQGGPFAYVINLDAQHDPGAAAELLRTFHKGGIEIHRADRSLAAGGATFPPGTYIIPPQAFRPFVVDLMEPKQYPDRRQYPGGPPEPPYDMTGYELSLQMGVMADRIVEPFTLPGNPVDSIPTVSGGVSGDGGWGFLLSPVQNNAARAVNRLFGQGARLARNNASIAVAGGQWPAGTWLVRDIARSDLSQLGGEVGVVFRGIEGQPPGEWTPYAQPRVALYEGFVSNMPAGWTRWVLEQYGFSFDRVGNAEIQNGRLSGYDVLLLSDQSAESLLNGHEPGSMPPEYTGGLGQGGLDAVRAFVNQGGVLAAFDNAIDLAIDAFDLPVRNVVRSLPQADFFIPGTLLNIEVDATHPVAFGMPSSGIAFFVRSQVMAVDDSASSTVETVARFPDQSVLASGWAHGVEHAAGNVAVASVMVGSGSVVLFSFEPHFRGQPHNTFKMLFNVMYHSGSGERGGPRTDR